MEDIFKEHSTKEWKNDLQIVIFIVKKFYLRFLMAIISGIALSGVNASIAWLIKPAVDKLLVEKNQSLLVFLPLGVFFLFILRGFFAFSNSFLMNSIGKKTVKVIRQLFYEKILRLPLSLFSQRSGSSLISRTINDIGSIQKTIASTAKNFFVELFTVIALAAVALYRRWDLAILSFTVIPLVVIIVSKLGKKLKEQSRKARKLISRVTKITNESISGIRIIKSFTLEDKMTERNTKVIDQHYRNVMRQVRIDLFSSFSMEIISGIGIAIIMWYGFYLSLQDKLTIGDFFSLVVAVTMMYNPIKKLGKVYNEFQIMRTAFHRIGEIFQLEDEHDGAVEKAEINGRIVFDNLSFKYPGTETNVINELNLVIEAGETLAIVGYSGAGKSTLTDLILGFWKSYDGSVLVDGVDIRKFSLKSLRSHIGVVSQDIILFDDTVKNNILFGKPDATEEEIEEAARVAFAHDFIMEMADGYNSYIGERGIKLSGGQKQRVSLARAIIKNPEILILDEATSSLDSDSELKIQKALEKILPGRTTIIVAHRLSTIKKADRIIVMDRGRIIQEGHHDELSSQEGIYKELNSMQFGLIES